MSGGPAEVSADRRTGNWWLNNKISSKINEFHVGRASRGRPPTDQHATDDSIVKFHQKCTNPTSGGPVERRATTNSKLMAQHQNFIKNTRMLQREVSRRRQPTEAADRPTKTKHYQNLNFVMIQCFPCQEGTRRTRNGRQARKWCWLLGRKTTTEFLISARDGLVVIVLALIIRTRLDCTKNHFYFDSNCWKKHSFCYLLAMR